MLRKSVGILLALSLLLTLTGCWDRVEIDQRGFVVGVAIDPNEENGKHKYKATYQLVAPGGLKQNAQNGGGAASRSYFNLSTTENSMPALSARMASKTSRSPYFEHLKIIVISDKLASKKEDFGDLLDFFLRNNEMRRGVQILISEGSASDIFNVQSVSENMPVEYITSVVKNFRKTNFMIPQSRIGDVHEFLVRQESYAIQRIKQEDEGITLNGCAIFDGDTNAMVGMLTGEETQGLNFITDEIKGGIIETRVDGKSIDFNIERMNRKIRLEKEDAGQFSFHISIAAEGTLDKSVSGDNTLDNDVIQSLQHEVEQTIENNCNKTIKKLQKAFKKDAMGLGAYLYENHYKEWKPIEHDWDQGENLFSQARISVQPKVVIRRIGNINQSERK